MYLLQENIYPEGMGETESETAFAGLKKVLPNCPMQ